MIYLSAPNIVILIAEINRNHKRYPQKLTLYLRYKSRCGLSMLIRFILLILAVIKLIVSASEITKSALKSLTIFLTFKNEEKPPVIVV